MVDESNLLTTLQAQEILLFHHLALESSRVYLYQPLVWRPRGESAFVPLSAFLGGVTKNSVSAAVFQEVCPTSETKHIEILSNAATWETAKQMLAGSEKCIVVDNWILNWRLVCSFDVLEREKTEHEFYLVSSSHHPSMISGQHFSIICATTFSGLNRSKTSLIARIIN